MNSVPIPEDAVEAAAKVMLGRREFGGIYGGWDGLDDSEREDLREDARLVLEAAAPMLLEKAAETVLNHWNPEWDTAAGSGHIRCSACDFGWDGNTPREISAHVLDIMTGKNS